MARIFDVIQVPSMGSKEIVRRVPEQGMGDFRIGSQLIVGPGQAAVFVRDGNALDAFDSGRHTITTANIPLLVNLIGKAFGGETPFKAEAYFVNMTEFPGMGWGTRNPIPIRHPGIGVGASLIISNGIFRMRVADPQLFVREFAGRQSLYTTDEIHDTLRAYVVSALKDVVGELGLRGKSAFDLPAMIDEVGAAVEAKVNDEFDSMGLRLIDFKVEDLNPKEESAETLAKMGLIDMGELQKYQFAMSMRDMAQQEGGGGVPRLLQKQRLPPWPAPSAVIRIPSGASSAATVGKKSRPPLVASAPTAALSSHRAPSFAASAGRRWHSS
jgi:membrane protease subunit (stomatin/prohibitin family)